MQLDPIFTGFADRTEAGQRLATRLVRYTAQPNTQIIAIPNGGVITAAATADILELPLIALGLGRAPLTFGGETILLIDDGLTMTSAIGAAVDLIRSRKARRIVVAMPVMTLYTFERIRTRADEIEYLEICEPFRSPEYWYATLEDASDAEVATLVRLAEARGVVA